MRVLTEDDALTLTKLEARVSCKWKWAWLKQDAKCEYQGQEYIFPISRFFCKIEKSGFARCNLCEGKEINYGNKGFHALTAHVKTKKHAQAVHNVVTTRSVAEPMRGETSSEPAISNEIPTSSKTNEIARMRASVPISVPLVERVANAEAMVLATIAQHNLPLQIAPVLVELSQSLALDKVALQKLCLSRTAASYKMREGMGRTFTERLLEIMRQKPFSLNLDESTSAANKKVLSVLVSFYNSESKTVQIGHLCSLELLKCTAEDLEKALVQFFDLHQIKFDNLVSMMLDSCAVMRGSKSGLEQRIRNGHCPGLLDVDGDSCHHIHNVAKKFVKPFGHFLESLFTDLHTDHQYAHDQLHYLMLICEIMEIPGTTPQRFIAHRWLSAYDITLSTKRMFLAYKVLYYGFLKLEDRILYKVELRGLYTDRHVGRESRRKIKEMHEDLRKKGMTRLGIDRKQRICQKIWFEEMKTKLHLSLYESVLPLFKEYILVFQGAKTLVHKLHDKQLQVMMDFLSCCTKSEYLCGASPRRLVAMDLNAAKLSPASLYKGKVAEELCTKYPQHTVVKEFLESAALAYIAAGEYMQTKLPLNSPTLQALSSIDPLARGHNITVNHLKRLSSGEMLGRWVPPECDIHREILRYNVDSSLLAKSDDIVSWWSSIMEGGNYPGLCAVACAALSIFHGPMVESSFSSMNDIIDSKSNRLAMLTYDAIQTTKYAIKTSGKSAVQMFRRDDVKYGHVDKRLCKNLLASARKDKARRATLRDLQLINFQQLQYKAAPSAAEATRQAKEKEAKRKRKRALELLSQAKRAKKSN